MRTMQSSSKKISRKAIFVAAIAAMLINAVIATLLVLSGSEIVQLVSGLTGADASQVAGLLKISGVLLWIAAFFFLCFFEAVLTFIAAVAWWVIAGFRM